MNQILVGDKGCTYQGLVKVILGSSTVGVVTDNWRNIARVLDINDVEQRRLLQNLTTNNNNYNDLFYDMFQMWRSSKGDKATLSQFVQNLESLDLKDTANLIRKNYELSQDENIQVRNTPSNYQQEQKSVKNGSYTSVRIKYDTNNSTNSRPTRNLNRTASTWSTARNECSVKTSKKTLIFMTGFGFLLLVTICVTIGIVTTVKQKQKYEYRREQEQLSVNVLRELKSSGALGAHLIGVGDQKPGGHGVDVKKDPNIALNFKEQSITGSAPTLKKATETGKKDLIVTNGEPTISSPVPLQVAGVGVQVKKQETSNIEKVDKETIPNQAKGGDKKNDQVTLTAGTKPGTIPIITTSIPTFTTLIFKAKPG